MHLFSAFIASAASRRTSKGACRLYNRRFWRVSVTPIPETVHRKTRKEDAGANRESVPCSNRPEFRPRILFPRSSRHVASAQAADDPWLVGAVYKPPKVP